MTRTHKKNMTQNVPKSILNPRNRDWKRFAKFYYDGKQSLGAHIVSWMIFKNEGNKPPQGAWILHTCKGNPSCVNPAHLYLGDPKIAGKALRTRYILSAGNAEN